jgi:LPS sulfotransferase NodH
MIRPFILLSTQRSGSTWVTDMLNSHPSVTAYSELLLQGASGKPKWGGAKDVAFWNGYYEEESKRRPEVARAELLFEYLDLVYLPRNDCGAVGFKLMYGQFGFFSELRDYIKARQVSVIHLIRENLIDVLISRETAVMRDLFHSRDEEPPKQTQISLEVRNIREQLESMSSDIERMRRTFHTLQLPYAEVFYERLTSDTSRFAAILDFLGVAPAKRPLRSSLKKLIRSSHRDTVENFPAVENALRGTQFEKHLRQ